MPLRSRKPRFRGWSAKDGGTSRRIRRGMPLLPLGLRKTTRSTTVFSGHGDSLVSSEQLAPTGCYSNINDGANTYRFTAPFCVVRRAMSRRRSSLCERCSHHAVEPAHGLFASGDNRPIAYFGSKGPAHLAWRARDVASLDIARDGVISWEQGWRCRKRRPALHTGARLTRRDLRFSK